MRMRVWIYVFGVGAVFGLATLPGIAIAKGGNFVIGPTQTMEFKLRGSNGYSISVFASGGEVSLTAKRGGSSAIYSAPGLGSPTRIKARFGRLGRVSVQFHSDHGPRQSSPPEGNCQGGSEFVDSGYWVGEIRFAGEQAYTAVHATRARGRVTKISKRTCSNKQNGEGDHGPHVQWTILQAASDSAPIIVTAFQITSKSSPSPDASVFGASLVEYRGRGLSVFRTISANAGAEAFAPSGENGHITSATISPPAPFGGTATFQRTKGSKGTWSGTLTGDFSGRSDVALAGLEFSAEISQMQG